MDIESIDLYVNYRCNYRCIHCFLGEKLNDTKIISVNEVDKIVKYCSKNFNTREIVLLGGEPTIHKDINEIIFGIFKNNIYNIRLVTNGGKSCQKFIKNFKNSLKPKLVFSIDGSSCDVHDAIRGKGTFKDLKNSIIIAKEYGYQIDAITSICPINIDDAINIVDFLDFFGFNVVNFHYITARGNAKSDMHLLPTDWLYLRDKLIKYSVNVNVLIRFETTFIDNNNSNINKCKIRERSNLMFFPDGNVFLCGLFIDSIYTSGFIWKDNNLIENNDYSEISYAKNTNHSCPGMKLILENNEQSNIIENFDFSCIYYKEKLNNK